MIDKIQAISEKVKSLVDEFKPKVPLMVALRKKGMKDRHWEEISKKVGIQIKPGDDPNFTFTKVLEFGLMDHLEYCIDTGERA